jgi:CHAD domain-containing protein
VIADRDIEDLHQMRVGMRRLRSTIRGFAVALDLPKRAREQKVGKIARILGELRDLDVLGEELKLNYEPHLPPPEIKILQAVREVLGKQRQEALQRVRACLGSKMYLDFKAALEEWLESPRYLPISRLEMTTVVADLLLPQASHLLLHSGWLVGFEEAQEVEKLLQEQGILLHDLRKEAKRSRYNMELCSQFYGARYQEYLEDIKTLQSLLGEIQDSFVLGEFLGRVEGKNWSKSLPSLVGRFEAIRQEKWQEWQPLQGKFLQPETRRDFHLVILNDLSHL